MRKDDYRFKSNNIKYSKYFVIKKNSLIKFKQLKKYYIYIEIWLFYKSYFNHSNLIKKNI